jgi:predicted ABC-class ATPase
VGGSGDYFDVADTVIALRDYVPVEVTAAAHRIAAVQPTARVPEGGEWLELARRVPLPDSLDPARGRRAVHIRAFSEERVTFGAEEVDLRAVEQLVEPAQARAIAAALVAARGREIDGRRTLQEALRAIMDRLEAEGLDGFQASPGGELAAFRVIELAAFLGRVRALRTRAAG